MSEKFKLFEEALIMLCIHHNVCLTVSDVYAMLKSEVSGFEDYPLDALPCMFDATKENT